MPFEFNLKAAAAVGVTLGVPALAAVYLRLKYGPTVWTDIQKFRAIVKTFKELQQLLESGVTFVDLFEAHVRNTPDKLCILFKDESYSYADIDAEANQMARFALHSGVVKLRDTVAMLMHNEPAFVTTWLAFNKIGVTTAFLNYNQKAQTLLNCIKTCGAKAIICGRGELFNVKGELHLKF